MRLAGRSLLHCLGLSRELVVETQVGLWEATGGAWTRLDLVGVRRETAAHCAVSQLTLPEPQPNTPVGPKGRIELSRVIGSSSGQRYSVPTIAQTSIERNDKALARAKALVPVIVSNLRFKKISFRGGLRDYLVTADPTTPLSECSLLVTHRVPPSV